MSVEEVDLTGYVCPLSRIKAAEALGRLTPGSAVRFVIGDADSLKTVAQELKARKLVPELEHLPGGRFVLSFTR